MERSKRLHLSALFFISLAATAQDALDIDCSLGVPVDQVYCYTDDDAHDWTYTSLPTGFLKLSFSAGEIESAHYDSLLIYDGTDATGTLLFQHTQPNQTALAGRTVFGASGNLFMRMSSDNSSSCAGGTQEEWHWTVECVSCVPPVATLMPVTDCVEQEFLLGVDITDLGSAATADVLVNGIVQATGLGVGVAWLGPFPAGTSVVVEVADGLDPSCSRVAGAYTGTLSCNDDCTQATEVTVNPDLNCASVTAGTVQGATPSGLATTCTGTPDDDVWFTFVATATTHRISLLNLTGSTTDLYMALWTGVDCASLVQVPGGCSDPNTMVAGGLFADSTYYVQVYTWSSTPGQTSAFDLCVGTPPPPPDNDQPCGAFPVVVNADLDCASVTAGTVASATPTGLVSTCSGTADDDVWFSFVATATTHRIALLDITGSTNDLFMAVWTGADCSALAQVPNTCGDDDVMVAGGLVPGQAYHLQVYTFGSTIGQTSAFQVCVGTFPPGQGNDDPCSAVALTIDPDFECAATTPGTVVSATPSGLPTTCGGTADDDVWFFFVATAPSHVVSLLDITGSTDFLVLSVWTGSDCGALQPITGSCSTSDATVVGGLTIGQTYYVRIYTWTSVAGQSSAFDVCVGTAPPPPGCGGVFYDNGGPAGTYAPSTNEVTTICPDTPGLSVALEFTSFRTSPDYDKLFVFNGSDVSAPLFASGNGPGLGNTTYGPGGWWGSPTPMTFTATNPSGCLTVAFVCDGNIQNTGWAANVLCLDPIGCEEEVLPNEYCYGNNENRLFSYAGSGGPEPLSMVFTQGHILANDYLMFFDGIAPQGAPLYVGTNGGDLAGFTVSSTAGSSGICFKVISNSIGSCADGTADTSMVWGVGCGTDWVGVQEQGILDEVSIHPNPAQDRLTVVLPSSFEGPVEFRLMDATGRSVFDHRFVTGIGGGTILLDLPELPAGMYPLVMIGKDRIAARQVQVSR